LNKRTFIVGGEGNKPDIRTKKYRKKKARASLIVRKRINRDCRKNLKARKKIVGEGVPRRKRKR